MNDISRNILEIETNESFQNMMDFCHQVINEKVKSLDNKKDTRVVYSIYECNFNEVAVEGDVIFKYNYWTSEADFESKKVTNPTWLDVAVLANDMLVKTGDYHVFFEGVYKTKEVIDGCYVYTFIMGS